MACYVSESDGSLKTTRTAHLSDGIRASISAVVERDYESQVAVRFKRRDEELASISALQEDERSRLEQLDLNLNQREEQLTGRQLGFTMREQGLTVQAIELDQQKTRQGERDVAIETMALSLSNREQELTGQVSELASQKRRQQQRARDLSDKDTEFLAKEIEIAGRTSDLRQEKRRQEERARELSDKDTELLAKETEIAGRTFEVQQEKRRQQERDRELGDRDAKLMFKEVEVALQAGEVKKERSKLEKTARGLDRKANRLSAKERELEERRRREEAEQRRRYQDAEAEVAALGAGVEAAHGEVMVRWREQGYRRVKAAVTEAKRLLRAGDLPKVHLAAERATAELEEVEKRAFEDERREEERKRGAGIIIAALRKVGFLRVGAKTRDAADSRSLVDIAGAMPSGKTVIFTLHHDGQMDIRQRGVSGHRECHSIEDAIAAATNGMGLAFRGARKVTVRGRRPAGPAVRATASARSKAPRRGT